LIAVLFLVFSLFLHFELKGAKADLIFSDGFETGDLSLWDAFDEDGIWVSSTNPYQGNYSVVTNLTTIVEYGVAQYNLGGLEYYAYGKFFIENYSTSNFEKSYPYAFPVNLIKIFELRSDGESTVWFGVFQNSAEDPVSFMAMTEDGLSMDDLGALNFSQWYALELKLTASPYSGGAYFSFELWIDGVSVKSWNDRYDAYGDSVDGCYIGGMGLDVLTNYSAYIDNIVIATTYLDINGEEAPPSILLSCDSYPEDIGMQVTVNETLEDLPFENASAASGDTYALNATSFSYFGDVYYSFSLWLINGSIIDYNNSILYTLYGDTDFVAYYLPIIPVVPEGGQYFFRSDSHTVNNVTAFQLDTTNTEVAEDANETFVDYAGSVTWGFRVYILHDGGTLSELTSDYEAQVSRVIDGEGYLNNTWICPSSSLIIGYDSVQVRVYTRGEAETWTLKGTFTTPRLLEKALESSTWMFNVYVARTEEYEEEERYSNVTSTFRFGDSTSANSYLAGVQFIDPNTFDLMMYNLNAGNFFTFILFPYTALIGTLFYGLLLLLLIVPVYIKYHSLDVVLFMLILFGGAGGFFSLLMPISGLQIGFFVMAFAIGTLLYKVVTSR
jgi:hypothetical protein